MLRLGLAFAFAVAGLRAGHAYEVVTTRAYCVYGKTTVETWGEEQMRVRYGSSQCLLNAGADPRKFLERSYGGTGRNCSC